MNIQKLIVSDFDGTLVNYEDEIPMSTVALIDEIRRKNSKFIIATGRALKSVLDYNKDFIIMDYIISSNGAYIYDVIKEKVIYKKNILISNVKKIINKYYEDSIIYLTDHITWNLISKKSAYQEDYDVITVDNYNEFLETNKNNIYKMELYFENLDKVKKAEKELKKLNLKINVNIQINNDKFLIEITHQEVNKFEGIKKLVNKLSLSLKDVLAFGDGYNDIELIKNAGCGVAVKNAIDEVKKVAKEITDDCNNKGVEKYLKSKMC